MTKKPKRPFIPKDKPKSWVIGILSGLIGMAIGLIAFIASWLDVKVVVYICVFLFVCCWFTSIFNGVVFTVKSITGKYTGLQTKEWKNQIW